MAKLSDFLGGLISGISDARVNSDLQSLKIAEEYAKDDLLKHFAVPRMRVVNVELNIPVAIDKLLEKNEKVYEPIDNKSFSSKAYRQILYSLEENKLSNDVSRILRTHIAEQIQILESKIRVNPIDNPLQEFSNNIALKVIEHVNLIYKGEKRKILEDKKAILNLQNIIDKGLFTSLKDEIKLKSENTILDSLQVIVESDKLREVKPENVIMIKMTISEQGMEWIKMENSKGEVINKLMPE